MSRSNRSSVLFLIYFLLLYSALYSLRASAAPQVSVSSAAAASPVDPDKPASERNHHIAGLFLIAIGLCSIWSKHRSVAWLRWVPPILFIAAGLFLAAWSDDEIWPRGHLNWLWLLRHDAEARQHKIYALLLIVLGLIEYAQANSGLRRKWLSYVFPVLCVAGGASLFFHQHSAEAAGPVMAGSAVTSPTQQVHAEHAHAQHAMGASGSQHPHHRTDPGPVQSQSLKRDDVAGHSGHVHDHAAVIVQRQHMWFAIVGFCVAAFKFLQDTTRLPFRLRHHLWQSSVIVLGVLLVLYRE